MPHTIDVTINAFVDFLVLRRQTDRMPERGEIHQMTNIDFSLHNLLLHTPIQDWPLPRQGYCPCSFCGVIGHPNGMEEHLRVDHPMVYRRNAFYTEIQVQLAGLLGVGLQVEERRNRGCPFGNCNVGFNRHAEIADHVLKCYPPRESFLDGCIGGFCTPILCHLHVTGSWPNAADIFAEIESARITLIPLSHEEADASWRSRVEVISPEVYGYIRPDGESPLEDLVRKQREQRETASVPHSVEPLDIGEYMREAELTDEELIE
jgi:hypothetical protein